MKIKWLIALMLTALIAAGCSAATPAPTNTPVPTATPKPTNTPVPTNTPKPTNTPEPAKAAADLSAAKITLEDLPATFVEFPQQQQAMVDAMEANLAKYYGPSAKLANISMYASTDAMPQIFMSWVIHPLDEATAAEFDSQMKQPDQSLRSIPGVGDQGGKAKLEPLKGADQLDDNSIGGTLVSDWLKMDVIIMRRGAALAYVMLTYMPTEKPSVDVVKLADTLDQRLQDAMK